MTCNFLLHLKQIHCCQCSCFSVPCICLSYLVLPDCKVNSIKTPLYRSCTKWPKDYTRFLMLYHRKPHAHVEPVAARALSLLMAVLLSLRKSFLEFFLKLPRNPVIYSHACKVLIPFLVPWAVFLAILGSCRVWLPREGEGMERPTMVRPCLENHQAGMPCNVSQIRIGDCKELYGRGFCPIQLFLVPSRYRDMYTIQ